MDQHLESTTEPHVRFTPRWVRIGVWVSIAFLTMSVITGMFLY